MGVAAEDVKARLRQDYARWENCLVQPEEVFLGFCAMKGHDPTEFRGFIKGMWMEALRLIEWIAEEEGAQVLEELDEHQFGY